MHLPLVYYDGRATGKEAWRPQVLDELLHRRIELGSETPGAYRFNYGRSGWYPLGADKRTQLVGAVLLAAPKLTEEMMHKNARRAAFCGDAVFDAVRFGRGAEFAGASFGGSTRFHRATFEGDVRFTSARFRNDADFEGAVFEGEASLFRSSFDANVSFRGGQFQDTIWFTAARLRNVEFRAREFLGLAYFDGATFEGQFDFVCATFAKLASFEEITWPSSLRDWHGAFDHTMFRSPVSFRRSGFKALASYAGAVFERGVQIDDVDEATANQVFSKELEDIGAAAAADTTDWFEIAARRKHTANVGIRRASKSCIVSN